MLHDKDIREPLFEFLDETYGKNRILEEKNIGRSRADVVMITEDSLYGIEIKSDADTYARLASQVKDYDKFYDYNYVVVGSTHGLHIREHVPDYWGVITVEFVDGEYDFYILRRPEANPELRWERKLEILWRPELAKLQEIFDMPKYKEKSKGFVVAKIIERIENGKIPEEDFRKAMCALLHERDYSNIAETLAEYRKGEIAKKLEREQNLTPEEQIKLIEKRELAKKNLRPRKRRRNK